jgi:hypothetical protein
VRGEATHPPGEFLARAPSEFRDEIERRVAVLLTELDRQADAEQVRS